MRKKTAAITEGATMAARLVLLPFELDELPEPGVEVDVVTEPSLPVTVYVTGEPVASGPDIGVCAGAVTVALPAALPPMTDCTAAGTW